nr:hypothetical protein [Tanacetum cinerariifolium]
LTTSRLIDGSPYARIDMVIKDLDLEPKIDAMLRDFLESKEFASFRKSLRCWFGSSDRSPWKEHMFCTNRMVSDRRGTKLLPPGSTMRVKARTKPNDEDPEEDPVDYPADGGDDGDDEEESSKDDEDEEDEMDVEADEEEEEEHPAPADRCKYHKI